MPHKMVAPKDIMVLFQRIMKEAGKFYNKPTCSVTTNEFTFISNGRLGHGKLGQLGGFSRIKSYYFPTKNQPVSNETVKMLERILSNAKN